MATETLVQDAPPVEEQQVIAPPPNAFDDNNWTDAPIVKTAEVEKSVVEEPKPEVAIEEKVVEKPVIEAAKPVEEPFVLDPIAKEKFLNDTYEILSQKKELEKIAKLDITKVSEAKKVLEISLKYSNSKYTEDEIKDEIEEVYTYPKQPKQKADEDTDEYEERMDEWKEKIAKIDKRIIRDAKKAVPELETLNSKLIIPEIPSIPQAATKNEPSPEDVAEFEKMRGEYLTSIKSAVKGLNEFTFTGSNKEVPVTVSYKVEDSQKASLEERFTDFDSNEFLQSRWLTKEGKFNGTQQAKDVYILENFEKIVQKSVNEAVAQVQLHYAKTQKNIDLGNNAPRGTFQPETKGNMEEVMNAIWSA